MIPHTRKYPPKIPKKLEACKKQHIRNTAGLGTHTVIRYTRIEAGAKISVSYYTAVEAQAGLLVFSFHA